MTIEYDYYNKKAVHPTHNRVRKFFLMRQFSLYTYMAMIFGVILVAVGAGVGLSFLLKKQERTPFVGRAQYDYSQLARDDNETLSIHRYFFNIQNDTSSKITQLNLKLVGPKRLVADVGRVVSKSSFFSNQIRYGEYFDLRDVSDSSIGSQVKMISYKFLSTLYLLQWEVIWKTLYDRRIVPENCGDNDSVSRSNIFLIGKNLDDQEECRRRGSNPDEYKAALQYIPADSIALSLTAAQMISYTLDNSDYYFKKQVNNVLLLNTPIFISAFLAYYALDMQNANLDAAMRNKFSTLSVTFSYDKWAQFIMQPYACNEFIENINAAEKMEMVDILISVSILTLSNENFFFKASNSINDLRPYFLFNSGNSGSQLPGIYALNEKSANVVTNDSTIPLDNKNFAKIIITEAIPYIKKLSLIDMHRVGLLDRNVNLPDFIDKNNTYDFKSDYLMRIQMANCAFTRYNGMGQDLTNNPSNILSMFTTDFTNMPMPLNRFQSGYFRTKHRNDSQFTDMNVSRGEFYLFSKKIIDDINYPFINTMGWDNLYNFEILSKLFGLNSDCNDTGYFTNPYQLKEVIGHFLAVLTSFDKLMLKISDFNSGIYDGNHANDITENNPPGTAPSTPVLTPSKPLYLNPIIGNTFTGQETPFEIPYHNNELKVVFSYFSDPLARKTLDGKQYTATTYTNNIPDPHPANYATHDDVNKISLIKSFYELFKKFKIGLFDVGLGSDNDGVDLLRYYTIASYLLQKWSKQAALELQAEHFSLFETVDTNDTEIEEISNMNAMKDLKYLQNMPIIDNIYMYSPTEDYVSNSTANFFHILEIGNQRVYGGNGTDSNKILGSIRREQEKSDVPLSYLAPKFDKNSNDDLYEGYLKRVFDLSKVNWIAELFTQKVLETSNKFKVFSTPLLRYVYYKYKTTLTNLNNYYEVQQYVADDNIFSTTYENAKDAYDIVNEGLQPITKRIGCPSFISAPHTSSFSGIANQSYYPQAVTIDSNNIDLKGGLELDIEPKTGITVRNKYTYQVNYVLSRTLFSKFGFLPHQDTYLGQRSINGEITYDLNADLFDKTDFIEDITDNNSNNSDNIIINNPGNNDAAGPIIIPAFIIADEFKVLDKQYYTQDEKQKNLT